MNLKNFPESPGVYVMENKAGEVIYIGKAKNLKKRLTHYFQKDHPDLKTRSLVAHIADIKLTLTHTAKEALLLESTLIKRYKPHYNIIFKDDKTYPFVTLSGDAEFPRLAGVRSRVLRSGNTFGPYPSMQSVKQAIQLLQKIFKIRTCEETYFKNRSRPCLLYQIKRCTAPCVGLIEKAQYQENIRHVKLFLEGRDEVIFQNLAEKMEKAASALNFEGAGVFRDQIKMLRELQESQIVHSKGLQNLDVIVVSREGAHFCVLILFIRGGHVLGTREYFPIGKEWDDESTILSAFVDHLNAIPITDKPADELILSHPILEGDEKATRIIYPKRGIKKRWLDLATLNAREALARHLLDSGQCMLKLAALSKRLAFEAPIKRIECFDISHTQGEETVASSVVFDEAGPNRQKYRRFNIIGVEKGDDYAATHQVLLRRFKRLQNEGEDYPDLVMIDGGKGQLKQAIEVLKKLQITSVRLLGISKGPERQAGEEDLWLEGLSRPLKLDQHDPAFLLIQHIRNEAHRFAITGHRRKRDKKRGESHLEDLPNIGPKRRQALLKYFGGWQEIAVASVDDLAKAPGLSPKLALEIHSIFHQQES